MHLELVRLSEAQRQWILWGLPLGLPAAFVLFGIVIWQLRRR
jgi:cytochrome c-type biogenesis protein CcmH/NrfF